MKELLRRYRQTPYVYFVFLFFIFSAVSLFNMFFPLYYRDGVGLSKTQIGLISAIIPVLATVTSPVWGNLADRSKHKNTVMLVLLAGMTVSAFIFPLRRTFGYTVFATCLYGVFFPFMQPLSDTMIAETSRSSGWDYGKIRLGGTFGFSAMCLASGYISDGDSAGMFYLLGIIMLISFALSLTLPKVEGHRKKHSTINIFDLLKDKAFIVIIIFDLFYYTCLGYYYAFYAVHLTGPQIGATGWLVGLSATLSALAEVYFLLNARKIVGKIGIYNTLIIAAVVAGFRWILTGTLLSPWLLIAVNMLHGFGHIVILYCNTIYISEKIDPELKASAQAAFSVVFIGITRFIGSIAGGYLSEKFGTSPVFLAAGCLCILTAAGFFFIFRARKNNESGALNQKTE